MKKLKTAPAGRRKKALTTETQAKAPRPGPDAVPAVRMPREDDAAILAQVCLHPISQAANTILDFNKSKYGNSLDILALVSELTKQVAAVGGGDLSRAEGMLISQAHTLNDIFNNLATRAHRNLGEYPDAADRYMRLAFKAQSQCRATLETLVGVKNPMSGAYVRQANIAAGHQQVNNGIPSARETSRAQENDKPPNELLETNHGQQLGFGTEESSGGVDPAMATVGEVHGANNPKGQGESEPQCLPGRAAGGDTDAGPSTADAGTGVVATG